MKLLANLILLLFLAFTSMAATVFPASTNGNNVFIGTNRFFAPIILSTNPADPLRIEMILTNGTIYWASPHGEFLPFVNMERHVTGENIAYMLGGFDAATIDIAGGGVAAANPRITLHMVDSNNYCDGWCFFTNFIGSGDDAAGFTDIGFASTVMVDRKNYRMWFGDGRWTNYVDGSFLSLRSTNDVSGAGSNARVDIDSFAGVLISSQKNVPLVVGYEPISMFNMVGFGDPDLALAACGMVENGDIAANAAHLYGGLFVGNFADVGVNAIQIMSPAGDITTPSCNSTNGYSVGASVGATENITVVTNGVNTRTLHFTKGIFTGSTAP